MGTESNSCDPRNSILILILFLFFHINKNRMAFHRKLCRCVIPASRQNNGELPGKQHSESSLHFDYVGHIRCFRTLLDYIGFCTKELFWLFDESVNMLYVISKNFYSRHWRILDPKKCYRDWHTHFHIYIQIHTYTRVNEYTHTHISQNEKKKNNIYDRSTFSLKSFNILTQWDRLS